MKLFNSTEFSSKNGDALRDFEVDVSSRKKGVKRSQPTIDPAWDNGAAFPEVVSSKNDFQVGDRVTTSHPLAKKKVYTIGFYPSIDATGKACYDWIETTCNLLLRCDSLTFVQELELDSATPVCNLDLTSLELQKPTITAQEFLETDIQGCITMDVCDRSLLKEDSDCETEKSTLSRLPPLVPPSQQKGNDLEQPMSEIVSRQSSKSLIITSPDSLLSKMSQVCSPALISQEMSAVTSGTFYSSFPPAGTMRTGVLSEVGTVPLPLLEKDYCWLPSPGALSSTGKGRPPGQTKQEGGLKDLGLLQKGEVLNPDILCEWYGLPQNWLDPSESRAATELLENNERQQEIFLIPELQRSHSEESATLIQFPDDPIPENFLEESQPLWEAVSERTGKQRKGCLYKYIENKKLKSGAIASYPRVIGHRDPNDPTHWRWGFNWEEKVEGEWKNRSLSVKLGAIPLIQSMQKESVSLEEIIGFIKRSKSK